ncbi:hypothetical protein JCM10207_004498 [Rhodosporidiobolus poonsookiae]
MGLASRLAAAAPAGGAPPAAAQQSYAPPSAAPPQSSYPGQQQYAPPAGAPPPYASSPAYGQPQAGKSQYAPPSGPPPPLAGNRPTSQYAPPPGPPPAVGSAYPGQQQYGAPQQQYGAPQQQYGAAPQQYGQTQQQQSYGAPAPAGGAPSAATDFNAIVGLLRHTVQDQGIQAFYPDPRSLEPIAHRIVQTGALARVAQDWRMPLELAMDLARLALFDVILYCDDSGSMQFEEGGSRIDDLKLIIQRVAYAASLFDDDGIEVRFMNSRVEGNGIKTDADVMQLVNNVRFSGLTPLGTALDQKVLQPLILQPARQNALKKPVVVIAVTDGVPGGEDRNTLVRVLVQASRELARTRYGADTLSVQLAQVGNDQKARQFLEEIDEHPEVGGLVDCTSNFENEEANFAATTGQALTPLCKMILGPISSEWDLKDESAGSQQVQRAQRERPLHVLVQASRELARMRYGVDTLSVQLAQVGNDQKARQFLEEIDEHPEVGGLVDCTSNFENEEANFAATTGQALTPLAKMILGPISSEWDSKDEAAAPPRR